MLRANASSSIRPVLAFLLASLLPAAGCEEEGPSSGGPILGGSISFDLECENPVAIRQTGSDATSGFVTCDDGFVHRAEAATCAVPEAPATCASDGSGTDTCSTSAECDERPHGACLNGPSVLDGCGCVYGCETDDDCATGEICACSGAVQDWPRCIPASCRDDGDCDGLCGLSAARDGCSGVKYELACLDQASECRTECSEERGCYDDVGTPPCEVVSGEWICNVEDLCEDCG